MGTGLRRSQIDVAVFISVHLRRSVDKNLPKGSPRSRHFFLLNLPELSVAVDA